MLDNTPQANCVSWTAMITAYGQRGQILDAKEVFDSMPEKDVVAWKAMLTAYAQNGHLKATRELYERIPVEEEGVANFMIIVYAQNGHIAEAETMLDSLTVDNLTLDACTAMITASSLDRARFLFNSMRHRDVMLSTAMIAACGDSGLVREARDLFDEMAVKDSVAWTTMIEAYARNGYLREAFDLFSQMPRKCVIPWSVLVAGYARAGNSYDSKDIFDRIPEHNVVSCTAMVHAYAQSGHVCEARAIFDGMVHRDKSCWAVMVAACTQNNYPALAFDLLEKMPEWENLNAMIVAYAHKGCLDQSRELFNSLESRDPSSWTAMIEAHACNGQSKEALETFWQMNQDGIDADEITFISVLHSCSHTGMVEKSLHQFVSMSSDHATEVEPALEHYHCIVDVLCRAGHLEEAEELVTRMPLEPDCVPWTTLLGGCRTHGDLERGSRVASKVFEMDPRAAAHYMLLCNIYVEGEVS
ncbi:pentatricopeptide repeat-containing protein At4g02750-like [Selaginella moellendorffii]|uniref:pentatricopeptide repeat-containing protein At4g02750-like n=1 Tax=Selaginella moellendorffii TaxID=88036 RepID=UPI000D1CC2F9|nr:pentatricopeptide repeat-containing protein At4g02750-like [Selaginella moellendorffii]|eukprot:XP_024542650.1 pentatricopeptide repeat-containing protein At4g02750-like [Selaginella moellendorffii]